jgi:hypothetical protein
MKKYLVKKGNKIKGFVYFQNGSYWYAFGRPSQNNYIGFECSSIEQGIARIEMHTNLGNI